jgi:hypothetical protein
MTRLTARRRVLALESLEGRNLMSAIGLDATVPVAPPVTSAPAYVAPNPAPVSGNIAYDPGSQQG